MDSEDILGEVIKMESQFCKSDKDPPAFKSNVNVSPIVSFISEIPAPIKMSMEGFIENHPNWDQYRFIQAAVARFLIQQGIESRSITRIYIENIFPKKLSKGELL